MALTLSDCYSDPQIRRMYRKVAGAPSEPSPLHIHIDSLEAIPSAATEVLLAHGFMRDDFAFSAGPRAANAASPAQHMTWKGRDREAFRRAWLAADRELLEHGVCCYLEGEVVALDAVLDDVAKAAFDPVAFARFCPPLHSSPAEASTSFDSPVLDAQGRVVGFERRVLPFEVVKRRLRPWGELSRESGVRSARGGDHFRISEIHLTLRRNGMDPRLLALLTAIGLSEPVIPKLIVDGDGSPVLGRDGRPWVIEDMPMTLQAVEESSKLVAFFDLLVKRVLSEIGGLGGDEIPGVERASVKFELAPLFGFYNGRNSDGSTRRWLDPRFDVPMVVDAILDATGRPLTLGQLTALGANSRSIAGSTVAGGARRMPPGLSGFWGRLHRESLWHSQWRSPGLTTRGERSSASAGASQR